MSLLKIISLITVVPLTLSSCVATNLVGIRDTVSGLNLTNAKNSNMMYIVKSTPSLAKSCSSKFDEGQPYAFWSLYCNFDKSPPDRLDIQYAKWMPYNQIPKPSYPHMVEFANSLPASAWQTYTVYPKQVVAQIKRGKNAQGEPLLPSALAEKKITLSLVIDENGNITMEDKYGYSTEAGDIR